MRGLANPMRLQAMLAAGQRASLRVGLVQNYDPTRYVAKVALQPDGKLTGWLQVESLWVGNGWGLYSPPSINELVTVVFVESNPNAGCILGRLFNLQDVPLEVQSGELWIVHKSGQSVKLTNDGKLTLADGQGATVVLNGDGTISSTGNWSHTGNLNATGVVTGQIDVQGATISLVNHVHPGVQEGSDNTGTPTG